MNQTISTYLMIKRHRDTGLMYFCKTATRDPLQYHGSGKYWKKHLKLHGTNVETLWYQHFTNKDDLVDFALFFSEVHNIVNATYCGKKTWANEVPEDGLQGGQNKGIPSTRRGIKTGITPPWTGKSRPKHSKIMQGRKQTTEHSQKISDSLTKYIRTQEHSDNISKAKTGLKLKNPRITNTYVCPHCEKIGKGPNMKRYHFNNCKGKKHG